MSAKLFRSDLTAEQTAVINRLYEHDETFLIASLGLGKTVCALTAAGELLRDKVLKRVLVVAPLSVAVNSWAGEVAKWDHLPEVAIACGTPAQRAAAYASPAGVVVTNFENCEEATKYAFDGIVFDELTRMKSVGGEGFKAMRKWIKKLSWRVGMTASPLAESPIDLYGQCLLIDGGRALGTRKQAFLDTYFTASWNGYDYTLKPGAQDAIAAAMSRVVFKAKDEQYQSELPGLVDEFRGFDLGADARAIYSELEENKMWGPVVAPNPAVLAGKLAQVAAGGLYVSEPKELAWSEPRDLDVPDEPVVVTYNFAFQLEWLKQRFPKAVILGSAGNAKPGDIAAFNRGEIPVLIGHPKSMSYGLSLQGVCRTMIHLAPIYSNDLFTQAIGRVRRRGQKRECHRIIYHARNTVDDNILQGIRDKNKVEGIVMNAL